MALNSSNHSDNFKTHARDSKKLLENFIGRELYLEVVDSKIDALSSAQDENDYFVLGLTGKAGRGKSFLSEKVIYNNANSTQHSKVISINFSEEFRSSYEVIDILVEMRNELTRLHNFKFKEFDTVIDFIRKKYATEIELHTYESSSSGVKKISFDAIKSILDNFTWGLTSIVIDQVGNSFKNSSVNKENIIVTDEQVKHMLNQAFIVDMKQNVERLNTPIIIIFDCFEDFRGDFEWLISGQDDSAVGFGYGLWHSIPNCLWIVSGREPLELTKDDQWDKNNFMSLDPLERFSAEETSLYLEKNSQLIGEDYKNIREKLYEYTEGSPLLLDLARNLINDDDLKTSEDILEKLDAVDFDKKKEQLVFQKYAKYIQSKDGADTSRVLIIKILVALEWWTTEKEDVLMKDILPKFSHHHDLETQLEEIMKLNFVETYTKNGLEVYRLNKGFIEIVLNGQIEKKPIINSAFMKQILDILVHRNSGYLMRHEEVQRVIRLTRYIYDGAERFEGLKNNLGVMLSNMVESGALGIREALMHEQQMFNRVKEDPALFNSQGVQAAFAAHLDIINTQNIMGLDAGVTNIIEAFDRRSIHVSVNAAKYYQMIGKYNESERYSITSHPLITHIYDNRNNDSLMFGASYSQEGITVKTMQEGDETSAQFFEIDDEDIFSFLESVETLISNKMLLSENVDAHQLSIVFFRLFRDSLFKVKFAPYILLSVAHVETLNNMQAYLNEITEIQTSEPELFDSLIHTHHAIVLTETAHILAKRLRRSQNDDAEQYDVPEQLIELAMKITQNSESNEADIIQVTNNIALATMFLEYRSETARDIFKMNYETMLNKFGEDSYHTFKAAYYYIYCLNQFQQYRQTRHMLYELIEKSTNILGQHHIFIGDLYKQLGVTYLGEDFAQVAEYYKISYQINRDNAGEFAQETLDRHFRWLENEYRVLMRDTQVTAQQEQTLIEKLRQLYLLLSEYAKYSDDLEKNRARVQGYLTELE
ncbi:MAG TPA: hypothetical protein K8V35_05555 [Aliicoccus persicus]|uniref:AAA ATPase domain-containing protein n=1 Tax=Aliicoccus persicus TaxID=930138 RepID=A0A921JCD3_9STAP|nr:hypothetical protein [Aliicoccus persicus]